MLWRHLYMSKFQQQRLISSSENISLLLHQLILRLLDLDEGCLNVSVIAWAVLHGP